tara:strand:+ start:223 stop:570 length:348 start_codon:yes stop_codon:yes gene_type:complete
MAYIKCNRTNGRIVEYLRGSEPEAEANHIVFAVPGEVDMEDRWNGNEGAPALRPPSAQEITDKLDAGKDTQANILDPILKAFALVMLDQINVLRAEHALAAISPAQLKAAVKAKL